MLLTKAMRERNEVKTILRYYRFVLVRIRTPDNYVLQGMVCVCVCVCVCARARTLAFACVVATKSTQPHTSHRCPSSLLPSPSLPPSPSGTFRPSESLSGVRQFVLSALASEAFPFNLVSTGLDLSDDTATLAELGLVSKPSLMYGT